MPNSFISVKEIARQTLPRLIENLVFPNLIHKDYKDEFVAGKGAEIQVKKPVVLEAKDFDQTNGVDYQNVKEDSVTVTLDKLATVDVDFTSIQMATNVDSLQRLYLEPAAVALAQKINSDGLELYKDIPYVSGIAGTTPSTLAAFAQAAKVLNKNKAPLLNRKAIWDPDAQANFSVLDALVNAEKCGTTAALREGSIGKVSGLENYMSQSIKTHTVGTLACGSTTPAIKVNASVTDSATVVLKDGGSGGTPALTGKLVKGDILTIDGKTYTVTADATADTTISVVLDRKLTVSADTVVTLTGSHAANLAFIPQAFAYVTRPLAAPSGVESYTVNYEGISLRVVKGYDQKYKKETLSMDVLYGYKTMYPELAVRALG